MKLIFKNRHLRSFVSVGGSRLLLCVGWWNLTVIPPSSLVCDIYNYSCESSPRQGPPRLLLLLSACFLEGLPSGLVGGFKANPTQSINVSKAPDDELKDNRENEKTLFRMRRGVFGVLFLRFTFKSFAQHSHPHMWIKLIAKLKNFFHMMETYTHCPPTCVCLCVFWETRTRAPWVFIADSERPPIQSLLLPLQGSSWGPTDEATVWRKNVRQFVVKNIAHLGREESFILHQGCREGILFSISNFSLASLSEGGIYRGGGGHAELELSIQIETFPIPQNNRLTSRGVLQKYKLVFSHHPGRKGEGGRGTATKSIGRPEMLLLETFDPAGEIL